MQYLENLVTEEYQLRLGWITKEEKVINSLVHVSSF